MPFGDPISPKQKNLITRLMTDLGPKMDLAMGTPEAEQVTTAVAAVQDIIVRVMSGAEVTMGEVRRSNVIDVLISADKLLSKIAAKSLTPGIVNADRIIANKFAKDCTHCGNNVEAGEGHAAQVVGSWVTVCSTCAAETPEVRSARLAAAPAPEVPQPTKIVEGELWAVEGTIYRIHCSLAGRLYTKRLTDSGTSFVYDASGMAKVRTSGAKLTLEEAKAFGNRTGQCCACARTLTDPVSIANGIGPICGARF